MRELSAIVVDYQQDQPGTEVVASRLQLTREAGFAADRAAITLGTLQNTEGYWVGDLTADSTLQSDYILLQMWLYPAAKDGSWNPPTMAKIRKAAKSILDAQRPDGGWNTYEPGPSEVNATVRAYTMLKLTGMDPEDERMKRAARLILKLGGIQACNSYTRLNFSFFNLFPRKFSPTIPAEICLIPGNVLYEMSSWTRAIIVPLSILQASEQTRPTPGNLHVEELFHPNKRIALHRRDRIANLFIRADKLFKRWERQSVRAIRDRAVREAEHWMLDRLHFSDGLGAIYPSIMYSIMAMDVLGYERDHPDLQKAIRDFEDLMIEDEEKIIFQPCKSPVWDTAIAAFALGEAGAESEEERERLSRAADWLLDREIRRRGDWAVKRPDLTPSGWVFEFANEYYPDVDDTAMVLLTLLHAKASDPDRQARAEKRAVEWILGMQSSDGGWAAFDVDNNWQFLNKVPFADHNAMLDPTCADITGRVLESLCRRGFDATHPAIERGVQYLISHQEENGSWFGRWGVNYVYGSFLALRGLAAAEAPQAAEAIARGVNWLRMAQNPDGGWGESCRGYETGRFERAESTPSQTAWAVLGLIAAGGIENNSVADGIRWLTTHQREDGTWDEQVTTGTGFPGVFYLSYHLYRNYFPVLALGVYRRESALQGGYTVRCNVTEMVG